MDEKKEETVVRPPLYASALPLLEERETDVVFGGEPDPKYTWGDSEEYGPGRAIAGTSFTIDKRYWEMLGKPDHLIIGISNEAGWDHWVGPKPPAVSRWLEATTTKTNVVVE